MLGKDDLIYLGTCILSQNRSTDNDVENIERAEKIFNLIFNDENE